MKKFFKSLLILLFVLFVLIQFYPKPQRNISGLAVNDIHNVHMVPANVDSILKTSCFNCHSNKTEYPWYFNFQPVSMWLGNHIEDGKKELNFSEFASYSLRKQYKKLEEMNAQVKEKEMPLTSYTIIHSRAKLDDAQRRSIAEWTTNLRDSMKASYPADSLLRKKS
ncbi:MAG: heme-binding domain-containing protein [Ferruginibacter sp.]